MIGRGSPVNAARFRATVVEAVQLCREGAAAPRQSGAATENPVDAKARQRKRTLDDRELALVWKAAEQLGYPFGSAVQLLILTGQRRNEVCAAPAASLTLTQGMDHRAGAGQEQRRASGAVERRRLRSRSPAFPTIEGEGDFLFTTTGDTPISGFTKAMARLDAASRPSSTAARRWRIGRCTI